MAVFTETSLSQILECATESVLETFGAICGEKPLSIEFDGSQATFDGIMGIVSYVGDLALGMVLGLPRATAIAMTEKFTGFEIDYDSPNMGDMVGELANILAGDLSARLDGLGFKNQISIPTIALGHSEILLSENHPSVPLCFDSTLGSYWLRIVTSRLINTFE